MIHLDQPCGTLTPHRGHACLRLFCITKKVVLPKALINQRFPEHSSSTPDLNYGCARFEVSIDLFQSIYYLRWWLFYFTITLNIWLLFIRFKKKYLKYWLVRFVIALYIFKILQVLANALFKITISLFHDCLSCSALKLRRLDVVILICP